MTTSARDTYRKVASCVRALRRRGASALEYPFLLRAANLLYEERDYAGARMARQLEEVAWRLDGLSRFPAGTWELPAISCASTFSMYKGYICGTIPNADGEKFHRLTGRWPTTKDGRRRQPVMVG